MSRHSGSSSDDHQRTQERIDNLPKSASPSPSSRPARIDSSEVYGSGGWITEQQPDAPAQLDLSEWEDTTKPSHLSTEAVSHADRPPNFPEGASLPSTPRTTLLAEYLNSAPFLPSSDVQELQRQQERKRTRSQYTQSSGQATPRAHSVSTHTEATPNDDADAHYHYREYHFTPSHTPSHHSAATAEENDLDWKAPDSPLPRSNYFPYNDKYGKGVVEEVEEQFCGTK